MMAKVKTAACKKKFACCEGVAPIFEVSKLVWALALPTFDLRHDGNVTYFLKGYEAGKALTYEISWTKVQPFLERKHNYKIN